MNIRTKEIENLKSTVYIVTMGDQEYRRILSALRVFVKDPDLSEEAARQAGVLEKRLSELEGNALVLSMQEMSQWFLVLTGLVTFSAEKGSGSLLSIQNDTIQLQDDTIQGYKEILKDLADSMVKTDAMYQEGKSLQSLLGGEA